MNCLNFSSVQLLGLAMLSCEDSPREGYVHIGLFFLTANNLESARKCKKCDFLYNSIPMDYLKFWLYRPSSYFIDLITNGCTKDISRGGITKKSSAKHTHINFNSTLDSA